MKKLLIKMGVILLGVMFLNGCMTCSSSWCLGEETYQLLYHPKAWGEYWEKSGMTKESWRQDWVACGGKPNGQYSSEAPEGATSVEIQADVKRVAKKLGTCMQSKGYEYHFTGYGASRIKKENQ